MLRDVRFLETHNDIFHAGKNFGKKHGTGGRFIQDLSVKYDEDKQWFEFRYGGRIGYIFINNCAFWEPEQETQAPVVVNEHKTDDKSKRSRAQVSTPQSHVFEGRGAGLK